MPEHRARPGRPLLEREPELAAVEEALRRLTGPRADAAENPDRPVGGLLAFAGPAGLGKTTLLAETRRRAADRGCTVLSARGGEQEQRVAFHVARQLLQPQLAGAGESELRAALGGWYDIVAPALGLCAAAEGPAPDPQGLRDGLDRVLTHLARRRAPVVLVLDDAHWADPESLGWLAAFAPRAAELSLLIVAAYRPEELPEHAGSFRAGSDGAARRTLDLAPLTAGAIGDLVRASVGAHADDAFCRECWSVTAGNPFEAVELAARIRDRGLRPDRSSAHLLRELAAAVKGGGLTTRLERLGVPAIRLAWAAAVLGTQISPALAADVAGLDAAQAAQAADRLRDARVLTGGATLEFVHPLIATAVYRAIPDAVRVALHGQAAWSVVAAGLGASAAARHLLETHPEGDPWVVEHLRSAARETLRAGAPEAARGYLARALREPPSPGERAAVLYELGCASLLLEPATTVNHLRAALEEPAGDPALREGILFHLSQALAHSDRLDEAADTVRDAARAATDPRVRLRMQAEQFMWDAFRADEPDSPARSRRLARLADRLTGRDLTERYIIGLRAWDAVLRGEPSGAALRHADRALAGGLRWAAADRGFEVPVLVALVHMYADRPGRAEELFAEGIAEFERQGWRGAHLSFGHVLLGYVRFRRGRLTEAEDLARAGLRLAERVGRGTPVQWYSVAVLIEVLLARGRVAEATELAADHDFHAPFPSAVTFPDAQAVHGGLLLARGMAKEAAAELAAAGRRLNRRGMRNPAWCPWQPHLALAEASTAPERARATALEAVARARQFGAPSTIGHTLRVAAEVSGPAERTKLLEESVAWLERSPAGYQLACSLVAHGMALRRAGRHADAARQLYRGLEGALQCGADELASRARGELTAAGLRPLRLPAPGAGALTVRERAAAARAAAGATPAAIAAALATDEATVGRLLSTVYRKLGTDPGGLPAAYPADPPQGPPEPVAAAE